MSNIAVLVFVAFLAVVVSIEHDVGYCRYNGVNIAEGDAISAPIGECLYVSCQQAATGTLSFIRCPDFRAAPGCKVGELNLKIQYPDCCPNHDCSERDGK